MDVEKKEGSLDEQKEQIPFLTNENVQLDSKLSFMQSRTAQQAASNQELSTRLVQSEEEKLKISKELVEVQIDANKLREKHETEILELQKKVFCQEGVVSNLEAELTRLKHEAEAASLRLQVAERNKCDMAEEYAVLKSNFLSMSEALEHEITHTKKLKDELLTLAHTHDTLLQERRQNDTHNPELQRVKALLSRLSHSKPEELQQGRDAVEDTRTHKTQNELWELLEKMRKSYEAQQQQLENKIVAMEKEQQENRRVIHNIQQDIAQQSATLLVSQQQLKDMEAENSNLQNQLKELNQEYRARLMHYIHDITESIQSEGEFSAKMKTFVDSMLKEVRVSYRAREEHLTSTLKTYRKRLHKIHNIHQQLLVAYRMQREQILVHTDRALEAGPPEANFSPSETELKGESDRELQRLRDDKSRLEAQLRIAQEKVAMLSQSTQNTALTEEAWADIRKQIREIAITTQEAHERERTHLITRAAVAEEQACELQEYVNNHLDRYKMEITRLREMLERFEAERSKNAELCKPRPHNQTLEKSDHEK